MNDGGGNDGEPRTSGTDHWRAKEDLYTVRIFILEVTWKNGRDYLI